MAKKKAPPAEVKKPDDKKSPLAKAKNTVVKAAEKVAEVVTNAAHSAKKHVVTPVAEAVGIVKKKRPRFVREKKEKKPETTAAPVLRRSKTTAGKLMSKNVSHAPQEESDLGRKTKRKP